jgi:hypothetical protein
MNSTVPTPTPKAKAPESFICSKPVYSIVCARNMRPAVPNNAERKPTRLDTIVNRFSDFASQDATVEIELA